MRKQQSGFGIALILALWSGGAATAQEPMGHYAGENVFRGSVGVFSPSGSSEYWSDKESDFTTSVDDFEDVTFALEYVHFVSSRVGLLFAVSGWEGKSTQSYRDFVDDLGNEISHVSSLEIAWLDLGVLFHLLSDRAAVMPYLGGGVSVAGWELVEEGEFIDFGVSPPEVIRDVFSAKSEEFGYFLLAGLEVPVSDRVALFAEALWRDAEAELGQDFAGFGALDLSGYSISAGVSVGF